MLCVSWREYSTRAGATFSIDEFVTEREYQESLRDHGEGSMFYKNRKLFQPVAVLKFDFNGYEIFIRSDACLSGKFIVRADVAVQSKQRFALSIQTQENSVNEFIRAWMLKRFGAVRVHEKVGVWDETLCGPVECSIVASPMAKIDRSYKQTASKNVERVLLSGAASERLVSLKGDRVWFWARGVPEYDELSSTGLGAIVTVRPGSMVLVERTVDFLKYLILQLADEKLIGFPYR